MDNNSAINNFRSAVIEEPALISANGTLRTPFAGNVRSLPVNQPPPLPQAPGYNMNSYGSTLGGGYGMNYGGGYGGFGNTFGSAFGGVPSYGYGGYGGGYGGYNRFGYGSGGVGGMNPMDPESRFIQLAEASSRPAFQSIESLVSAIGNIASMLDSTFYALTSSFHAVLGVAANFGRLRGVFGQFWQTFAIFRALKWIYRKILYWLRISNLDPSSEAFKKAFAEAVTETSTQSGAPKLPRKGQSPWPVLAFLSFIFTAPYLIMKLLGTVTNTAQEEARNPAKWVQPILSSAIYDFPARNATELSIRAGQRITIAPREIQNTLGLLNTGWALATTDGVSSGIVPINYIKSPQQMRQEQQQLRESAVIKPESQNTLENIQTTPVDMSYLSPSAFPTVSAAQSNDKNLTLPDFDIAPQPLSVGGGGNPPSVDDIVCDASFTQN